MERRGEEEEPGVGQSPAQTGVPPGAAPAPRAGTHWYRLLPCCRFWPSLARLGLGSLAMSKSEGRERRGMSAGKESRCQDATPLWTHLQHQPGAPGHAPLWAGGIPRWSIPRTSLRPAALS